MNIVGLDLSLTAIGVASPDGPAVLTYDIRHHATYMDEVERLRIQTARVDRLCRDADVVVIENFPARASWRAHQMGEIHGLVKVCLLQRGIPFALVGNSQLKKYATDNGGANKGKVLAAAIRDGFAGDSHDAADAYFLRHMGLAHYLNNDEIAPKYRKEVLGHIVWPRLETKEEAVG